MKKYRLKDRALQKKLDEISGGDFSQKLQEKTPYQLTHTFVEVGFSREKGKNTRWFTATFRPDEIEEVPTYDPTRWNAWPDVEPPKGVLMRVEVKYRDRDLETPEPTFGKVRERTCARFTGEYWIRSDGSSILFQMDEIVRFRPWEE